MAPVGLLPALDVGGTHVTGALVDVRAGSLAGDGVQRRPLRADAPAAQIIDAILACARATGVGPGAVWGIAIPGPFDYAAGIGRFHGVGKFETLNGVDLGAALRDGLGAARVTFLNDADAFVLGEWTSGAAAGHRRAVGITLGTGVGSAFLADGVVVDTGADVPPEGRVDLLTIGGRPLEDTISRRALLARHAALTGAGRPGGAGVGSAGADAADGVVDVVDIAERARAGDPAACRTIEDAIAALGAALAPWVRRFRASVVVVGGAIAGSWDLVEPPLQQGIVAADAGLAAVEVVPAAHPDAANLIGAAHRAATTGRSERE